MKASLIITADGDEEIQVLREVLAQLDSPIKTVEIPGPKKVVEEEKPEPAKRSHKKKPAEKPKQEEEEDDTEEEEDEKPAKKKAPEKKAPAKKEVEEEGGDDDDDDEEFDLDAIPKKKGMEGLRLLGAMLSKSGNDDIIDKVLEMFEYASLSEVKKEDHEEVFNSMVKKIKRRLAD